MKLLRDKINRSEYMCSKLCGMIERGDLRDNHPQQRKSGQWDNETRDNFIVTVIKNEDFDPIKICEQLTDKGVILWLIDGLQRSTTIENFKSGKFALGRNIDPYIIEYQELEKDENGQVVLDEDGDKSYVNISYDLRGKSYTDLPEKVKEDFNNCPIMVVKHLDCTDKEVGRHIVRYNSGRKMVTAQKITTCMYNNAKYMKELSSHAFFNDCANYSNTADKNGSVDKVVAETIMGLNFFDLWKTNAKTVGKFLNENATKEHFDNLNSYMNRLLDVVTPKTGKLFSTKNAFIWFMLFDRFNTYGLEDKEFALFLENFDELKNVKVEVSHEYELEKNSGKYKKILSFFELDGCKSTKDKGIVSDKLHILETVMRDFLHMDEKEMSIETEDNTPKESEFNEEEPNPVEEFIRQNIKSDVTEADIEDYYSMLEIYKKKNLLRKQSPLLDWENEISTLGFVAYFYIKDIDLDDWLKDFDNGSEIYNQFKGQKEKYIHMKEDFENYLVKKGVAA